MNWNRTRNRWNKYKAMNPAYVRAKSRRKAIDRVRVLFYNGRIDQATMTRMIERVSK